MSLDGSPLLRNVPTRPFFPMGALDWYSAAFIAFWETDDLARANRSISAAKNDLQKTPRTAVPSLARSKRRAPRQQRSLLSKGNPIRRHGDARTGAASHSKTQSRSTRQMDTPGLNSLNNAATPVIPRSSRRSGQSTTVRRSRSPLRCRSRPRHPRHSTTRLSRRPRIPRKCAKNLPENEHAYLMETKRTCSQ